MGGRVCGGVCGARPVADRVRPCADGSVGVGLLTVLTFNEVVERLKDADVTPTDLDVIVCNCGAYIMYSDMDGNWKADEAWEAKALYRWDKKLVVRCAALRIP